MNKVFALLMVLGLSWSVAQAQTTSESEKPACTQAPEACPPQCYPETEEAKTCLAACKAKASACTPTPKACAAPTACAGATAAAAGTTCVRQARSTASKGTAKVSQETDHTSGA